MTATHRTIATALAIFASSASAKVLIKNHCTVPVQVVQSHNGGCDYGTAGPEVCVAGGPGKPWVIQGGGMLDVPFLSNSDAVAIKVSKGDPTKITQVEYCASDHRYWDLSDIDGDGAARTGSPFRNDNVGLIPSGSGLGAGTCKPVLCRKGKQCEDAYQFPDQTATRACPLDTGELVLDLCMDQQEFDVLAQRWYPDGAATNLGQESGLQDHASYEGNQNDDNQEYGNGNNQEVGNGNSQEVGNGNNQEVGNGNDQQCLNANGQPCQGNNGEECHTANGQPCQSTNGQQCLNANGQPCQGINGEECHTTSGQPCQMTDGQECLSANGQPCQGINGEECHTTNGQPCQSPGTVPQPEPVVVPAPASASAPGNGDEPGTNNNGYNPENRPYGGRNHPRRLHTHRRDQKRNATPSVRPRPRPRHLRVHQHQGHSRRMHARSVAVTAGKE